MKYLGRRCGGVALIGVLLCVVCFVSAVDVQAKERKLKIKVVKVTNKQEKVLVKVKINNNSKKSINLSSNINVYEKINKKWGKIKWNADYAVDDSLYCIFPKKSTVITFSINKRYLTKKLKKGKTYKIGIKVNGKIYKARFKIKKKNN